MHKPSEQEHKFTSTGIKFWRHQEQMLNYRVGNPNTVISTHISPEGVCNLSCPYCSVTERDIHNRIEVDVIMDYVYQLKARGLKAVILTGGGEPTAYKEINELVQWLKSEDLSVALITNGTLTKRLKPETLKCFSWIRVSINAFEGWEDKIQFPYHDLNDDCVVGCSTVFTPLHEKPEELYDEVAYFNKCAKVADRCGAKYIRVLPNCLLPQDQLIAEHARLDEVFTKVGDTRFFHQYKLHGAPNSPTCHQAYFRPYLSEVGGGMVFPCDSVVLNDELAHFNGMYSICAAEDIGEFMDRRIQMKFDPRKACAGCVFTKNVNMLEDWVVGGNSKGDFDLYKEKLVHEEFV
jgi:organic radical activating enzyme